MPRSDAISANLRPPPRFTTDMSSTMLLRGPRIVGRHRLIAVLRVPANDGATQPITTSKHSEKTMVDQSSNEPSACACISDWASQITQARQVSA